MFSFSIQIKFASLVKRNLNLIKNYSMIKKSFREHLNELPDTVKRTDSKKFYPLLVGLFLLPGGSFLCLFALYLRFLRK